MAFTDLHEIGDMFATMSGVFDVFSYSGRPHEHRNYHIVRPGSGDQSLNGPAKAQKRAWNAKKRADPEYLAEFYAKNEAWRKKKRETDPEWVANRRAQAMRRHYERVATDPEYVERRREQARNRKHGQNERNKAKRAAARAARESVLGPELAARVFKFHKRSFLPPK